MYKKGKRIAAVLLALTLLWQPSWNSAISGQVQAEEKSNVEQEDAGQQTTDMSQTEEQADGEEMQDEEAIQEAQAEADQQDQQMQIAQEEIRKEQQEAQKEAISKKDVDKAEAKELQSAPDSQSNIEDFKGVLLEDVRISDEDQIIQAGESFNVLITWKNTLDEVAHIEDIHVNWTDSTGSSGDTYGYYDMADIEPGQEKTFSITVDISDYAAPGQYTLNNVWCNVSVGDSGESIMSDYYTNGNYWWNGEGVPIELAYEYNGEADYTVENSGPVDQTMPVITKVTVEPAETSTYGEVTAIVEFTEEGSGINSLNLDFTSVKTGETESAYWSSEDGMTTGSVEVPLKAFRELGDEYYLSYAGIQDCAGYFNGYALSEEDGRVLSGNAGENDTFSSVSYKVTTEEDFPVVLIENISIENADKDNLSAGDSFELVMTLRNDMDQPIQVMGDAIWQGEDTWYMCDRNVNILPGQTGDIRIPVTVNRYAAAGSFMLEGMSYTVYDSSGNNQLAYAYYSPDFYNWTLSDSSVEVEIPESMKYTYDGQADYTVTNAPTPDSEAPAITDVSVMEAGNYSSAVGTFDAVQVLVGYEENLSGISSVHLEFSAGNDYEHFDIYQGDTAEGRYTGEGTFTISSRQVRQIGDEYQLSTITVHDYAGNSTSYYAEDGQMVPDGGSGNALKQPKYTVTTETPLEYVLIKEMKLIDENGAPIDADNVTAGDSFNLEVTFYNNTEESVNVSGFGEWYSEGESNQIWTENLSGTRIDPGAEGSMQIRIDTSKYSRVRTWKLERVYYNIAAASGGQIGYGSFDTGIRYGEASYNYSIGDEYFQLPADQTYQYSGEADYVIANAPNADETAPVISGITINDEDTLQAKVGTTDNIEAVVHYTEETSGIRQVTLVFTNEDGIQEEFTLNADREAQFVGNDTVLKISSRAARNLDTEYSLVYASATDFAGNTVTYNELYGDRIESGSGEGFTRAAYAVENESDDPMLIPTGIRLEGEDGTEINRNQLSAGDAIVLVLEVKNTIKEDVRIETDASWNGNDGTNENTYGYSSLGSGQGEIRIPFEINLFSGKTTYTLDHINAVVYDENDNYVGALSLQPGWGVYTWDDTVGSMELPYYEYAGEGDYTVINTETPDTDAPYISSMKLVTDPVSAPGEIEFEIKADTGAAKIEEMIVQMIDKEEPENLVYVETTDLYYSAQRQCYVLTASLTDTVLKGEYELYSVDVYDEAGRYRDYSWNGDVLTDNAGSTFENSTIEVSESAQTVRDFDAPVITGFRVESPETSLPGQVTFIIEGQEESGISNISLSYRNNATGEYGYSYMYADRVSDNQWKAVIDLGRYASPGQYEVLGVSIYDASPQTNSVMIQRNNGTLDLSQADFAINGTSGVLYIQIDGTEAEQLEKAQNGQKVVFSSTDFIPAGSDILTILKEKGLQAVFTSAMGDGEVLIDGNDLTDEMAAGWLQIDVGTNMLNESEDGVIHFENGYDRMAQSVFANFYSAVKIPCTVRWKVDEKLIDKATENGNARLSSMGERYLQIEEENVTFTSDGYYEREYPNGFATSGNLYISTDTVKYFDYPLTVTATPSFTSDTITKGSSFDVELSVTNNNNTTLKDVAVFALYNLEEQCPWYAFESKDANVAIVDGDALISELKPGQTVKLTAKFDIPEDTDLERVPLTFVASSVTSDDEIIAYGDDESRITLQDKQTVLKGDMTQDGMVDIADLSYMLQVVSERISIADLTSAQLQAGDVSNSDGVIDLSDLSRLLQYVSERITSL